MDWDINVILHQYLYKIFFVIHMSDVHNVSSKTLKRALREETIIVLFNQTLPRESILESSTVNQWKTLRP